MTTPLRRMMMGALALSAAVASGGCAAEQQAYDPYPYYGGQQAYVAPEPVYAYPSGPTYYLYGDAGPSYYPYREHYYPGYRRDFDGDRGYRGYEGGRYEGHHFEGGHFNPGPSGPPVRMSPPPVSRPAPVVLPNPTPGYRGTLHVTPGNH